MDLSFHSQGEFEDFARTYMLGVQARDGIINGPRTSTSVTHTVGDVSRTVTRTDREVLACAAADTGLTVEELEALGSKAAWAPESAPENTLREIIDTLDAVNQRVPDHVALVETPPDPNCTVTPEAPKRKRRTKAEIAAEAEAVTAALAAQHEPAPTMATDALQEGIAAVQALTAQADTSEKVTLPAAAADPIAEAAVKSAAIVAGYTPEIIEQIRGNAVLFEPDRMAQMNEGRDTIKAKGFMAYNAVFAALGLSPNIATHNDDEVRLHRAAIAHLTAS